MASLSSLTIHHVTFLRSLSERLYRWLTLVDSLELPSSFTICTGVQHCLSIVTFVICGDFYVLWWGSLPRRSKSISLLLHYPNLTATLSWAPPIKLALACSFNANICVPWADGSGPLNSSQLALGVCKCGTSRLSPSNGGCISWPHTTVSSLVAPKIVWLNQVAVRILLLSSYWRQELSHADRSAPCSQFPALLLFFTIPSPPAYQIRTNFTLYLGTPRPQLLLSSLLCPLR